MRQASVGWEESDTFNPAAVVKDDTICVLYRAEDNSATGIGMRTSRIGLAQTTDGVTMIRRAAPVMYPAEDNAKAYEWEDGSENESCKCVDSVMSFYIDSCETERDIKWGVPIHCLP